MNSHITGNKIVDWVLFILVLGVWGVFLWRWFCGSRERSMLVWRWCLTFFAGSLFLWSAKKFGRSMDLENAHAYDWLAVCIFSGLFLLVVWAPAIAESISRGIGGIYTGGNVEVEPAPVYSVFMHKRNHGKYQEALAEVRKQLDQFPTDYEGHMLLAQLQAENLNDLAGAELTIHRLCAQPNHAPPNIAHALSQLADWHLNLHKDRDAAQAALLKIQELLPDSEMSLGAAQRLAHLSKTENLVESHDRRRITVPKGIDNLGLIRDDRGKLQVPEVDYSKAAEEYVDHLRKFPLDAEVREKLSILYAKHFHRLDLAIEQLEQLIQQPNQFPRNIVHWLNLMVDLQVQEGAEFEHVRATLQRIIDQFPEQQFSDKAKNRLDVLKIQFRVREQARSVKLGTYDQNIGLKRSTSPPT